MSDAVNPIDLIDAVRIYVPDSAESVVDAFVVENNLGKWYLLIALLGEDTELGEEFFVLHREEITGASLPFGGIWKSVDRNCTVLNTVYKARLSDKYRVFQEFNSVSFLCDSETVLIDRYADDFGIQKMHIIARKDTFKAPI